MHMPAKPKLKPMVCPPRTSQNIISVSKPCGTWRLATRFNTRTKKFWYVAWHRHEEPSNCQLRSRLPEIAHHVDWLRDCVDVGLELDGPVDEVRPRPSLAEERELREPLTKPPNAVAFSVLRSHLKAWHSSNSCNLMSSTFFAFSASLSNLCFSASVPNNVVVFPSVVLLLRVLILELYPLTDLRSVQDVLM